MQKEEEEIEFEPEEEAGGETGLRAKLQKLKDDLARTKEERREYLEGWQRCKADAVNAKKETEARAARSGEFLREALVHDIIPALDSFDMASGSDAWSEVSESWRNGMEMVRQQLLDALKSHGVERFGRVGEICDPGLHEVVGEADDVAGSPGSVVRILRFGYRTGERVLRPAQVVVKSQT